MGRKRQTDIEYDAPKIGHNSNLNADEQKKLSGYLAEIEKVEGEIKVLNTDRGELYKSLKESGFDTKAVKHIVKVRKMERAERETWENAVDAYMHALGMLGDTPLGQAAVARDLAPIGRTDVGDMPFAPPADDLDVRTVADGALNRT